MNITSQSSDTPYCRNCGYTLTGLTESSKCPECGRPLVDVLTRGPRILESGKRYRSTARLWGMPVVDIAVGPKNGELRGKARGVIAIGDEAMGILAIGGVARGVVAIGGAALGCFSIGGGAFGLISALGGGAVGGIAVGGGAAGILAYGGGAAGVVAQGGGAAGMFTRSALGVRPQSANEVFSRLSWFFGGWPTSPLAMVQAAVICIGVTALAAGVICLISWLRLRKHPGEEPLA